MKLWKRSSINWPSIKSWARKFIPFLPVTSGTWSACMSLW